MNTLYLEGMLNSNSTWTTLITKGDLGTIIQQQNEKTKTHTADNIMMCLINKRLEVIAVV